MEKETLTIYTDEDGRVIYTNADGERHNPHGPAVIWADGSKEYWISGQLHNPHGPAIVYADGYKEHYINDQLHNPHGPAIVYADGKKWYYINDKELSEAEFKAWQVQQDAPLHNKIAVIGGVEYTLTEK
jgi:hypothetical protein